MVEGLDYKTFRERIEKFARENSVDIDESVLNYVFQNEGRCPCRLEPVDCPCVFASREIEIKGHCLCQLFIKRRTTEPEREE